MIKETINSISQVNIWEAGVVPTGKKLGINFELDFKSVLGQHSAKKTLLANSLMWIMLIASSGTFWLSITLSLIHI